VDLARTASGNEKSSAKPTSLIVDRLVPGDNQCEVDQSQSSQRAIFWYAPRGENRLRSGDGHCKNSM
jgi:hypothetical protein